MRTRCTNSQARDTTEKRASGRRPLPQWTADQFYAALRRLTDRVHNTTTPYQETHPCRD